MPEAIRTYAELRKDIYVRDNILGIVEEPFTGFRVLVPHALVDKVLELAHTLGAHEGLKKLMCRLNRSFFWPSMRRDASLFVAACPVCDKFRSLRSHPRSPLHPFRIGYRGDVLAIDLVGEKEPCPPRRMATSIYLS